jgi:hypothetical protein
MVATSAAWSSAPAFHHRTDDIHGSNADLFFDLVNDSIADLLDRATLAQATVVVVDELPDPARPDRQVFTEKHVFEGELRLSQLLRCLFVNGSLDVIWDGAVLLVLTSEGPSIRVFPLSFAQTFLRRHLFGKSAGRDVGFPVPLAQLTAAVGDDVAGIAALLAMRYTGEDNSAFSGSRGALAADLAVPIRCPALAGYLHDLGLGSDPDQRPRSRYATPVGLMIAYALIEHLRERSPQYRRVFLELGPAFTGGLGDLDAVVGEILT